jgi:hypothetical protein
MAMAAGALEFPSASLTSPSSLSLSVASCTRSTGAFGADADAGTDANCGGYRGGNAVGVDGACGVGGSEGGGKLRPGSGGGIMPAGMLFCISCNHSGGICGGQLKACSRLVLRRQAGANTRDDGSLTSRGELRQAVLIRGMPRLGCVWLQLWLRVGL